MSKQYMSARDMAEAAHVSVRAVYQWIKKGELPAETVRISEFQKRYRIKRSAASLFLKGQKNKARRHPNTSKSRSRPSPPSAAKKTAEKPRTGAMLVKEL